MSGFCLLNPTESQSVLMTFRYTLQLFCVQLISLRVLTTRHCKKEMTFSHDFPLRSRRGRWYSLSCVGGWVWVEVEVMFIDL